MKSTPYIGEQRRESVGDCTVIELEMVNCTIVQLWETDSIVEEKLIRHTGKWQYDVKRQFQDYKEAARTVGYR